MPGLRKMTAGEITRRLHAGSDLPNERFAFFHGAGCSISSGIPGADSLVRDNWLPRLRESGALERKDGKA